MSRYEERRYSLHSIYIARELTINAQALTQELIKSMGNHQIGDLVNNRYRIVKVLGQGGVGITYQAVDIETTQQVALKVLSFQRMGDWKTLELFEREAKVLSHLNHPAIPRYLDYFQVDTEGDRRFYIAQQLVDGVSLADLIDSGWRGTEADIKEIASQILQILIYLHELQPPVIHRDIKPQNLIRRSDRTITLVDFGAVQDTYRHTQVGRSTIVGTYGYMPPEQFRGKALPASDLFGLGATILFMLTGRSPADLPEIRMKIDFRGVVYISKGFADWLEKMLEPAAIDRFTSAHQALEALQNCDLKQNSDQKREAIRITKPFGSRVKLTTSLNIEGDRLEIFIPPLGWSLELIPFLGFALFWNSFVLFWTIGAAQASVLFALFSTPFWIVGIFMLVGSVAAIASNSRLIITNTSFRVEQSVLAYKHITTGKVTDLQKVEIGSDSSINDQPVSNIMLRHGVKTHKFGVGISAVEKEWLLSEIVYFLENVRRIEPA
jgi:eukaryotic-like serine/threonine-protein kinase